jgi:hypothetical protein
LKTDALSSSTTPGCAFAQVKDPPVPEALMSYAPRPTGSRTLECGVRRGPRQLADSGTVLARPELSAAACTPPGIEGRGRCAICGRGTAPTALLTLPDTAFYEQCRSAAIPLPGDFFPLFARKIPLFRSMASGSVSG